MKRKLALAALAGLFATAALAAKVQEEVNRTVPLSAEGELEISNVNGSVEITAWDREEVEIRAVKSADNQESLDQIEVVIESSDDSVEVETKLPRNSNGASVDYQVRVPLSAEVSAETVNGSVRVSGSQGPLDLESVNGALNVEEAQGPVDAETVNGSIEVRYAETASGSHSYESVNGAIHVYLPTDAAGSFRAETVNGGISTDFPLEVKKAKFGPMSSLNGQLGEGGPDFEFETVNGSIDISGQ